MEDPALLILDEPMNWLDKAGIMQRHELFLQFKTEGKTMLLVSHSKEDIDALCDKVYELEDAVLSLAEA